MYSEAFIVSMQNLAFEKKQIVGFIWKSLWDKIRRSSKNSNITLIQQYKKAQRRHNAVQYHLRIFEYWIYRLRLIPVTAKSIKQNNNTTTGRSNIEYTSYHWIYRLQRKEVQFQYHLQPFEYRIYRLRLIAKFNNTTSGYSNIEYTGYVWLPNLNSKSN